MKAPVSLHLDLVRQGVLITSDHDSQEAETFRPPGRSPLLYLEWISLKKKLFLITVAAALVGGLIAWHLAEEIEDVPFEYAEPVE